MGTDAAGIPRGWKLELQGCRGDGVCFCGKPVGHLINLADDKNSGASVRILGKLSREISYVAVNNNNNDRLTAFDPGQPG